ncbi:hypothetical protein H257_12520 [Aphanomyces astaci]|uniref:Lysophospholipid acyltransferase n=1 Tax=Aphanomyces astaci TaxID=112090 RepID=W4FZE4_APHAT|nr:hypothetical protein H257_12520 [Aphanomyces astaci]ETV72371.1 hypothetical protein H257_12520 [Aphanomyces astaci]RQM26047.1 hypothetical protein B5M09_003604 [Aphanomyces astaci]|eukprot:XP_009838053.1 hypothetical protein H257_12520 [Aphanomyces astaci]
MTSIVLHTAQTVHAVAAPTLAQFAIVCDLITPLKFEALNAFIDGIVSPSTPPPDVLRYTVCLFGAYPFATLFPLISSPTIKHLVSLGLGVAIAQFVFGSTWVHPLIMTAGSYVLVLVAPRRHVGAISLVWNLVYLSFSHLYRMYVDYMGVTLEISGAQMIVCMKLTAFAYNIHDGVVDGRRFDSPTDNKNLARVFASRKALAVTSVPSLLEYFSFAFCFSTFLAGPSFEFREYIDVINGTKVVGPGRVRAGVTKLSIGLFYVGLTAAFGMQYPTTMFFDDAVAALPWYKQIPTLYFAFFLFKCRFYGCWTVAEGATVLCGFGYEGVLDGKHRWNGVQYMNVWEFEFASCHRDSTRKWNKVTQGWLEKYIYSRTNNSLVATYFVSALWHGFYPGYYLFFMLMPLPTAVNRVAHKKLRPWFLEHDGSEGFKKHVYDVVGGFLNALSIHYISLPFLTLGWTESMQAYTNLKFSGHIVLVTFLAVLTILPTRKNISAKRD